MFENLLFFLYLLFQSQTPTQLNYIQVEFSDDRPQAQRQTSKDRQTEYTDVVGGGGKFVVVAGGKSPASS